MKRIVVGLVVAQMAFASFGAEEPINEALVKAELAKGVRMDVWPEGRVFARGAGEKAYAVKNTKGGNVRLTNVVEPELTRFAAPGVWARPAVLVLPGGGYAHLSYTTEGTEIAAWLNRIGFSAFVLKYRCPGKPELALADAQRALSAIRAQAAALNVDPKRIGVIGFSAGANLAVRLSTNWRTRAYPAVDGTDAVSCRPDFTLPIYPWDLVAGDPQAQSATLVLRGKFPVDEETPPAFMVQSEDDFAKIENALAYYTALKYAGVAAEMHLFPTGGHGYGLRKHGTPVDDWEKLATAWLRRYFAEAPAASQRQ